MLYRLNQILLIMTVNDENDPVNQFLDKVRPHVAKLTFGSIVGYCSGAAAKKIGRALAVLCGLGFIAIQSGELQTCPNLKLVKTCCAWSKILARPSIACIITNQV